ncbi:hypothetical protein EK904_005854 [Melospiza melodia maxima]|nr:hypothetical protein EK904_005854 [Melospiza melodia maxima]
MQCFKSSSSPSISQGLGLGQPGRRTLLILIPAILLTALLRLFCALPSLPHHGHTFWRSQIFIFRLYFCRRNTTIKIKSAVKSTAVVYLPVKSERNHHHLARAAGGQRGRNCALMSCKWSQYLITIPHFSRKVHTGSCITNTFENICTNSPHTCSPEYFWAFALKSPSEVNPTQEKCMTVSERPFSLDDSALKSLLFHLVICDHQHGLTSQYNYIFYFHVVSYFIPVLNYFTRATYTELQDKKQEGKTKDSGREKGKRQYRKMHSIKYALAETAQELLDFKILLCTHYSAALAPTAKYNKNVIIAMKPAIPIPTQYIFQAPMSKAPPFTTLKHQEEGHDDISIPLKRIQLLGALALSLGAEAEHATPFQFCTESHRDKEDEMGHKHELTFTPKHAISEQLSAKHNHQSDTKKLQEQCPNPPPPIISYTRKPVLDSPMTPPTSNTPLDTHSSPGLSYNYQFKAGSIAVLDRSEHAALRVTPIALQALSELLESKNDVADSTFYAKGLLALRTVLACNLGHANTPQYFVTMKMLRGKKQRLYPKTAVFYGLTTFPSLYFGAQTHPQKPRRHIKASLKVQHYEYPLMKVNKRHTRTSPLIFQMLFTPQTQMKGFHTLLGHMAKISTLRSRKKQRNTSPLKLSNYVTVTETSKRHQRKQHQHNMTAAKSPKFTFPTFYCGSSEHFKIQY